MQNTTTTKMGNYKKYSIKLNFWLQQLILNNWSLRCSFREIKHYKLNYGNNKLKSLIPKTEGEMI